MTLEHSFIMNRYLVFVILVFGPCFMASADTVSGKVVFVVDGNTVLVVDDSKDSLLVILTGIDSPELGQEYGDDARRFLEKLVLKKEVVIELTGKDRKGNQLGIVLIKGKTDLRVELLKEGLAWTAEKNPTPELEQLRIEAEQKKIGLWKLGNPTPPWTYRRQQTMLQAKSS